MTFSDRVRREGFAVVEDVIDGGTIATLSGAIDVVFSDGSSPLVRQRGDRPYAIRDALTVVTGLRAVAVSPPLFGLAAAVLGRSARCIRATIFDKPVDAGWGLPWHRDEMIAVREQREVAGFQRWSVKSGLVHVRPPDAVLRSMLALRLSLDANDGANGALEVIPRSHLGSADPRPDVPADVEFVSCGTGIGGVVAMRPQLLHGSREPIEPRRRRVVHFEYAAGPLPQPLRWLHELRPSDAPPTGDG